MEFTVHDHDDRTLDLEFMGERRTVLMLLKERLLTDEKVSFANVLQNHPVLDEPRLVINTEEGRRPATALKKAASGLRKDIDAFEDALLDEL